MSKVDWSIVAIVGSGGDIEKARKWLLDRGLVEALAEFDGNRAARAARRAQEVARLDGNRAGAASRRPTQEMATPIPGGLNSSGLCKVTGANRPPSRADWDRQAAPMGPFVDQSVARLLGVPDEDNAPAWRSRSGQPLLNSTAGCREPRPSAWRAKWRRRWRSLSGRKRIA